MTTYRYRKSSYSALEAWHKLTKKLGFRPKKGQVSARHTPGFWVWFTTLNPKKGKARTTNKAPATKKKATANPQRSRAKYKTSRSAWNSVAKATGLKPSQVKPAHTKTSWRWKKNSELLLINKAKKKNPKRKSNGAMTIQVVKKFPGRAVEIKYNRTGKLKGPYFHRFKNPPKMYALKGGGLLLK